MFTFQLSCRKCDKNGCNLVSPLWQLFQCGHWFHIECNLPAVSECHVCKAHLIKQIEDLASKANTAVYNRADETDNDNDEHYEDETIEAEVDFEGKDAGEVEVQAVFAMIQEISLWLRPSPPSC